MALFSSLLWALSVIAYVPMGFTLGAVGAVSFAHGAFTRWLAWFSLAASFAHFVMTLGLTLEGLVALTVALCFYAEHRAGWGLSRSSFCCPISPWQPTSQARARAYSLVHSYSSPLALLLLGTTVASRLLPLALIRVAHSSIDRFLGFGLQYPTGAGETHLGRIGRRRPIGQAA